MTAGVVGGAFEQKKATVANYNWAALAVPLWNGIIPRFSRDFNKVEGEERVHIKVYQELVIAALFHKSILSRAKRSKSPYQ